MNKMTFALFFGNRGFFPGSLIAGARKELTETFAKQGYQTLIMEESETRWGAVETVEEGKKYAAFLKKHEGKYDGVVLSLPNFGDETGAIAALQDCGVPILIQAYPDEIGKMENLSRRDAFCGKFSIMDIFYQYKLPFTAFKPHTVHPCSENFQQQVKWFAAVCRVVKGMKKFTVGAVGARTTAFKTVRFDELALQRYGITTETLDLSELFLRVKDIETKTAKYKEKIARLKEYTSWDGVPEEKLSMMAKVGVAIDDMIIDYELDCLALRCWIEIERELRVSPCVILSELNERGIAAACEVDVCNAIPMYALSLASEKPSMCLDWNNNYGEDENRCIIFHCGPVAQSLMTAKGRIIEQHMLAKALEPGCAWGCNTGRIAASSMTFASSKTESGRLVFYTGEGRFTGEPIEEGYFGCGGVVEINGLQDKLLNIGKKGFRHHVSATFGHVNVPVTEAMKSYLGYDLMEI